LLYAVGEQIPKNPSVPVTFTTIDSIDFTSVNVLSKTSEAIFEVFNEFNTYTYTVEEIEIALQHLTEEETIQLQEMLWENDYLNETETETVSNL